MTKYARSLIDRLYVINRLLDVRESNRIHLEQAFPDNLTQDSKEKHASIRICNLTLLKIGYCIAMDT